MTSLAILRRAIGDTTHFFGWNLRSLSIPILFFTGTGVHLWRFGLDAVIDQFQTTLSYGLIPTAAFAALLFMWNVWLAPSRMLFETLQTIEATKGRGGQVSDANATQRASKHWALVDELKVWQAAHLVEDLEPNWPMNSGDPAFAASQALVSAIIAGTLKATAKSHVRELTSREKLQTTVKKDDFIEFCRVNLGKIPRVYESSS